LGLCSLIAKNNKFQRSDRTKDKGPGVSIAANSGEVSTQNKVNPVENKENH
jgi:hypothetical protein